MKDNLSVLETDLQYAESMVRAGCATVEQAAQSCGIRVSDLKVRLAGTPQTCSSAKTKLFQSFNV